MAMHSPQAARVLIVMAMAAEADPIISALGLTEVELDSELPARLFQGPAAHLDLAVAVNGVDTRHGVDSIGTVPAALTTYLAASIVEPQLIMSAGTAGGWHRHGTVVGDVFLSDASFVNHDRRIPLGAFDEYGIGRHPGVDTTQLADRLGFKVGTVTTSNSLDESITDATAIRQLGGRVKEMEAAAVAYVAEQLRIPVMAVKTITDLVDEPAATAEQFTANLTAPTDRLREAVVAVLLELDDGSPRVAPD